MNDPRPNRREVFATLLLALAAVATAWASYQATRWHGEQAMASSRTNAIRIEAARASSRAETEAEVDVATFTQWVQAEASGESALADFWVERFRPEFRQAYDAWIETEPLTNPDAPLTPFAVPEYRTEAEAETEQLDQDAEESSAEVRRDIQRASNYVLAVVLFAAALFFGGMSIKASTPGLQRAMLAIGWVVLLGTVAWLASFPLSISV